MRKITSLIVVLLMAGMSMQAQIAYNPFTQNIHFEPEPDSLGFPCGTVQTVAFTQGLTTAADATQWQSNPLTVIICLTGFTFNGSAASVVTGSYASNFDWAYDSFAPNCIIGTQNQTLPGTGSNPINPNPLASGDIKLSLLVPETSPISTVLAVNVNLQVPGYMSQFNSTPDDNESTQTQTSCSLVIKGNVFNDTTDDTHVNGTPIHNPSNTELYASLLGPGGTVVAVTPITASGAYSFTNVSANTTYTVVLSVTPGVIGSPAPVIELPTSWVNTGEDCCDNSGNDGSENGQVVVQVVQATKINVNFGIKNPNPTGPLPVVVKNFFVHEYNCSALLSWTTSQEQNTSHVDVYRKDGKGLVFKKIATVQSAGMSTEDKVYSYQDKEVKEQEESYEYELKFVDIDGKYTMSSIKSIRLNCNEEQTGIDLFPNPAQSELNLLYVTEAAQIEMELVIMDMVGRKVMSSSHKASNGSTVITLDISRLAKGNYVIKYYDMEGLTNGSMKFLKQ